MTGRWVRLRAPAKINLGLRVLGELKDGTHSIETIYQAVDLFDDVELALGDEAIRVGVHGQRREGVPEGENNLAARAADALLEAVGQDRGVEIRLTKRIPAGSGLGGGSSDAAAVLHGLALLLGNEVGKARLESIAAEVGADVPFFLRGGTAFGYHRGAHLLGLPALPALPALVVVPDIQISTFWAYHAWDLAQRQQPDAGNAPPSRIQPDVEELARCGNDFERLVFDKFPEVQGVWRTLTEGRPLVARLSGTGSACYALYPDAVRRDAEAERLSDVYRNRPDYGIFRVRLFGGGVEVVE